MILQFQFPNRFRIIPNGDLGLPYSEEELVSIPEPVQDYSEYPLFEPLATQGV